MIDFMKRNHKKMPRRELARALGVGLTSVRSKCYELGLYKMRLEYWTEEQVAYLKNNYKTIGDLELSEIFARRWFKEKGWTRKHIAKKRGYLKLKRSERQRWNILLRNADQGRFDALRWAGTIERRRLRVGTVIVRTINGCKVKLVRVKGGFRKLAHINYENSFGAIPSGKMIVMRDGNPLNCDPANLIATTRSEHAERMRNSDAAIASLMSMKMEKARRGRPRKDVGLFNMLLKRPDLIDAKRKQLQLTREINAHE